MLESAEYSEIKAEIKAEIAAALKVEYEAQCRMFCYGPYQSWTEITARFLRMREFL